jgi:hypothetical protein
MSIQRWMTTVGVVCLIAGLACLLIPGVLLPAFGMDTSLVRAFAARVFGAVLIGYGVLGLTARGVPGRASLGAIAGSLAIAFGLGTILAVWGALAGVVNGLGWGVAVVLLIFTLAMGAYRFTGGGS